MGPKSFDGVVWFNLWAMGKSNESNSVAATVAYTPMRVDTNANENIIICVGERHVKTEKDDSGVFRGVLQFSLG